MKVTLSHMESTLSAYFDMFDIQLPTLLHMSRDSRKPVVGVSDQVPHKSICTVNIEILDLRRRRIVLSVQRKQRGLSASQLL